MCKHNLCVFIPKLAKLPLPYRGSSMKLLLDYRKVIFSNSLHCYKKSKMKTCLCDLTFLVEKFLEHEGPVLLQMRVKQLIKEKQLEKAALLAKICIDCSAFQVKGDFKQMYLVCLCGILEKDQLMEEVSRFYFRNENYLNSWKNVKKIDFCAST